MTDEELAAQLWCLPQHSDKEMDVKFAKSIAEALRKARQEERERCAKEIESWIKYYSIEFFEDVKSGEHGKRVDDCTAHTMRVMLPRLAQAIRRLE